MDEFKNNKDGKINELKVRVYCHGHRQVLIRSPKAEISKLKSVLQKQAVKVKTHQKELQTATLELGLR